MAETFSQVDANALLDAIEYVAASTSVDELRHRTLSAVPKLVPTELIGWNEIDPVSGEISAILEPDLGDVRELADAFGRNSHQHPVIRYYQRTLDGRPHTISDFVSAREFHQMDLYRDFYGKLGAEDQLSFVLPKPDKIVGIALNRPRRDFSSRDRSMLNRFRPHVVRTYEHLVAQARFESMQKGFEDLVERDGEGVLLLDSDGEIEYVSPNAGHLLGLSREEVPTPRWLTASINADEFRSRFADEELGLVVERIVWPERAQVAFVLSEQRPATDVLETLQRLGLTRREAEVMRMVSQGHTNRQIAIELYVGLRTVETHVQHALDKLGVENRTAAAHLIANDLRLGG